MASPPGAPHSKGFVYALSAFAWWGALTPVYIKLLGDVPADEVLCHRIIWSLPICLVIIQYTKGWAEVRKALSRRDVLPRLALSATLIAVNWLVFIYAIASGQMLEASLGYYINPLVSVALGCVFLKERLRRAQVLALVIAGLGTLNQTLVVGKFPWIALVLPFTFAFYGLIRKTVRIEAVGGLFAETAILTPPALAYLIWLYLGGKLYFFNQSVTVDGLLLLAGLITAVPLIFFTAGARLLPLSMVGFMQYCAPSMTLLLAVLVYGEPFTLDRLITFGCIWTGLVIFSWDAITASRRG